MPFSQDTRPKAARAQFEALKAREQQLISEIAERQSILKELRMQLDRSQLDMNMYKREPASAHPSASGGFAPQDVPTYEQYINAPGWPHLGRQDPRDSLARR